MACCEYYDHRPEVAARQLGEDEFEYVVQWFPNE